MSELSGSIDRLVASVGGPTPATPASVFTPSRYPYTYGYDYLRQQASCLLSRGETAGVVRRFAQANRLDTLEVCIALADRMLAQEGVEVSEQEKRDALQAVQERGREFQASVARQREQARA